MVRKPMSQNDKFVVILVTLMLAACSGSGSPSPAAATTGLAVATPSRVCSSAPAWLTTALKESIAAPDATLSPPFVSPVTGFVDGPPIVLSDRFAESWWVGGKLTDGSYEGIAIWVTNSLDEADPGLIFAASAAARRYSELGADIKQDILGRGDIELRFCIG